MAACGPFAIDMYLSAFPQIANDLHVEAVEMQLTLSVFLLGLALGQIFWGTLSDHLGRRYPLIVGCLLYGAAGVCCGFAPSLGTLVAARFAMGLGGSAGAVISRAIVRDLFEEDQAARFFSMMMIIGGIAPIIAPTIGAVLLTYWNWRGVFWCVGAFGFVCAVAVAMVVKETLPRSRRLRGHIGEVLGAYWSVGTDKAFLAPALAMGLISGVLFTYISTSPAIFIGAFGVSARTFSILFAVNAIGLYGAGQLNRILLGRVPARSLLHRASLVNAAAAVSLLLIAVAGRGGLLLFFPALFVCLASLSLIFPNATAVMMQPFASRAGTASAIMGTLQFVTGAVCSSLVGLLPGGAVLSAVCMMAGCSIVSLAILHGTRRRQPAAGG